tara:strand:+ start:434 stop:826 length:393 start_codon:yes stop_codon:yes gene_type:complete
MRSEIFYIPFQGPSTNAIYGGQHWTRRKASKDEAREIVLAHVSTEPFTDPVALQFVPLVGKGARTRDLSNYTYGIKLVEDGLVSAGILVDDTDRYVQSIRVYQPIKDRDRDSGFILRISEVSAETPEWAT